MTLPIPPANVLPHHKLIAYKLALELVKLIARTRISDAQLRQQARKSVPLAALNSAEGAARQTIAALQSELITDELVMGNVLGAGGVECVMLFNAQSA
jgi:hypothetical protein